MPGISLQTDTSESSDTETEPINEAVSSTGHAAHVTNTESPNNSESPNTTTLQTPNVSESTPLNMAAMQDNADMVKLFIDAGANNGNKG